MMMRTRAPRPMYMWVSLVGGSAVAGLVPCELRAQPEGPPDQRVCVDHPVLPDGVWLAARRVGQQRRECFRSTSAHGPGSQSPPREAGAVSRIAWVGPGGIEPPTEGS